MKKIIFLLLFLIIPVITLDSSILTEKQFKSNYIQRKNELIELNKLKTEIKEILKDTYINNTNILKNINKNDLLYMEKLRKQYKIPINIFYRQVWAESNLKNNLISCTGAVGYMQIMPNTFKWVRNTSKLNITDINNSHDNITAGVYLIHYLKIKIDKKYPNESEVYKWKRVLSSYNAGYAVHQIAMYKYKETKKYIKFILYNNILVAKI